MLMYSDVPCGPLLANTGILSAKRGWHKGFFCIIFGVTLHIYIYTNKDDCNDTDKNPL